MCLVSDVQSMYVTQRKKLDLRPAERDAPSAHHTPPVLVTPCIPYDVSYFTVLVQHIYVLPSLPFPFLFLPFKPHGSPKAPHARTSKKVCGA